MFPNVTNNYRPEVTRPKGMGSQIQNRIATGFSADVVKMLFRGMSCITVCRCCAFHVYIWCGILQPTFTSSHLLILGELNIIPKLKNRTLAHLVCLTP